MVRSVLVLVLSLFLTTLAQAEVRIVNAPTDGFLNLRTGPGSQFDVVMEMDHGTAVEVLEVAGNWARVRHETGATGWAFRKYMIAYEQAPGRMHVYSPGDGYLNLRTGPGSDFAIITRMYDGEWVQILERQGNWVRVFHEDGDEGWAYSKYLRR